MALGQDGPGARLLGFWRFDGDGSDASGRGRPVVPSDPVHYIPAVAEETDGDTALRLGKGSALDIFGYRGPAADFTFEILFRTTQRAEAACLATTFDHTKYDADGMGGWDLSLRSGRPTFTWTAIPGGQWLTRLESPRDLADGRWHHLAFTVDPGNRLAFHVDGELIDKAQGHPLSTDRNHFRFGLSHAPLGNNFPFEGDLDEIRLTRGVLLPSEFLALPNPPAAN